MIRFNHHIHCEPDVDLPPGPHDTDLMGITRRGDGDSGDEDPLMIHDTYMNPVETYHVQAIYLHKSAECKVCIAREIHRAKSGWQDIDGALHVIGNCPSCEPHECARCGFPQHSQAVYDGIAYECEHCEAESWEQVKPRPESKNGFVIRRSTQE